VDFGTVVRAVQAGQLHRRGHRPRAAGRLVVAKLNIDESIVVAQRHGLLDPTLILTAPAGWAWVGFRKDELERRISAALG
jgi:hypothetical protein